MAILPPERAHRVNRIENDRNRCDPKGRFSSTQMLDMNYVVPLRCDRFGNGAFQFRSPAIRRLQ
jgi:hypothetical protein